MKISPREVLHACVEPKIMATKEDRDRVIVRMKTLGEKEGKPAEVMIDVMDYYDEKTGFTAMERTTGWHGAIVAIRNARKETPRGGIRLRQGCRAPCLFRNLKKNGEFP